jgi:hypothetical protein
MADSSADRDPGHDTGIGAGPGSTPSTPRWVKVFGIVALVVVVLIVLMLLVGGGSHGPGRHLGGAEQLFSATGASVSSGDGRW